MIDTTAVITESNPIYCAFEVFGPAHMSPAMSMNSRIVATTLGYLGLGYLYSKGRDLSKRIFHITDQTKERIQSHHDIAYTVAFNLALSPPMYAASQALAGEELNWEKIAAGTATSLIIGAVNGIPLGYTVEIFRDLTGIKECHRPSYAFFKEKSSKVKRLALASLISLSIGALGAIY